MMEKLFFSFVIVRYCKFILEVYSFYGICIYKYLKVKKMLMRLSLILVIYVI